MATKKDKVTIIDIPAINPVHCAITIEGTTDIVLNKMDDYTKRTLINKQMNKPKSLEKPNEWEQIVTSIHWQNPPQLDPNEYTEDTLKDLLENDSPCISAYGLKKQLCLAVSRYGLDSKGTVFDANVRIIANNGLIPIKFTQHYLDTDLVPTQGLNKVPVLSRTNRFSGWSAEVLVEFMENMFTIDSIVSIFNLTGFNLGIGSRKKEDFGRFTVTDVKPL